MFAVDVVTPEDFFRIQNTVSVLVMVCRYDGSKDRIGESVCIDGNRIDIVPKGCDGFGIFDVGGFFDVVRFVSLIRAISFIGLFSDFFVL